MNEIKCSEAISAIAHGDNSKLEVIYDELGRDIFAVAIAILHDYQSAQDIMQDTFVQILRKADSFDEKRSARAWIIAITRNLSINRLREYKFSVPSGDLKADCVFDFNASDDSAAVYEALAKLDEQDRQIVVLKAIAGFSHGEISDMLGITKSNAQKKYTRALKKLESYLMD